jgi:antirestriction protein ArdC
MEARKNVYQMVTDRIVEMMQNGLIPWQKPWHGPKGKESTEGMAISYVTRRAYSVINQWLLGEPGEYLTFKQIQERGGSIIKGEKSRMVVFFTKCEYIKKDEETGEEKLASYPLLKYYNVWHINQTTGIESKLTTDATEPEPAVAMDAAADAIIEGYLSREEALKFQNNKPSNRAYYSPSEDKVVVPMPEQYDAIAEYYSTTFHELVHSTLKASRCDREAENKASFFGNHEYSREELVAEIG